MDNNESPPKLCLSLLPHQQELIQLSELAGIHGNPDVFRIIIELLNMGVEQAAIFKVMKLIRRQSRAASKHKPEASS